jgi:CarboxypepD_reg-like domain
MKTGYSISIPQPCSERWDKFTPKDNGRHCASCDKVVIDFTKMSDAQILTFLQHKKSNTCGRFRHDQMKGYSDAILPRINSGFTLLKAGIISMLLALISKNASGQIMTNPSANYASAYVDRNEQERMLTTELRTIRGVVYADDDQSPIAGANVAVKGTNIGTTTNAAGEFSIDYHFKEGDVLVFTFIGYQTREYKVNKESAASVTIDMSLELRVEIMGELAVRGVYEEQSAIGKLWNKIKNVF